MQTQGFKGLRSRVAAAASAGTTTLCHQPNLECPSICGTGLIRAAAGTYKLRSWVIPNLLPITSQATTFAASSRSLELTHGLKPPTAIIKAFIIKEIGKAALADIEKQSMRQGYISIKILTVAGTRVWLPCYKLKTDKR